MVSRRIHSLRCLLISCGCCLCPLRCVLFLFIICLHCCVLLHFSSSFAGMVTMSNARVNILRKDYSVKIAKAFITFISDNVCEYRSIPTHRVFIFIFCFRKHTRVGIDYFGPGYSILFICQFHYGHTTHTMVGQDWCSKSHFVYMRQS